MPAAFQAVHMVLVAIYAVTLAILAVYGMYRYVQIAVCYRPSP